MERRAIRKPARQKDIAGGVQGEVGPLVVPGSANRDCPLVEFRQEDVSIAGRCQSLLPEFHRVRKVAGEIPISCGANLYGCTQFGSVTAETGGTAPGLCIERG